MFGKLFAGLAAAGVLAAVLATGAMAAPAGSPAASPAKQKQQQAAKDIFKGTVALVGQNELSVKNGSGTSRTFLRSEATVVVKGRNQAAAWSEIEVGSHVRVRFEEKDGKLYARRVHIGNARLAGKVTSVSGNVITIRTRDGKDARITVTGGTKYFEITGKKQRTAGSLSAIHAGLRLAAAGSLDSSHNLDASIVAYRSK